MARKEVVSNAIAAINARDADAYIACCTEDVELFTPLVSMVGAHRGADGVRRFFADIDEAGPDFRLETKRLELVGDRVLAVLEANARGRSSGLPMEVHLASVYEFAGDRIRRVVAYQDLAEALGVVGLEK